jgi:hypothetical protein
MRAWMRWMAIVFPLAVGGCYSHTREVVVEHVPTSCREAIWVPPAEGSAGYWRCTP